MLWHNLSSRDSPQHASRRIAWPQKVEGVAYLNDWLLYDSDPRKLATAVVVMRALGITIDEEKSTLEPTNSLVYLGFRIDTHQQLEITITRAAHNRLYHLLRFVRQGSDKDRQRVAGYALWVLFNLRMPSFLARDILRGDPTWLLAAIRYLPVLQPKELMDWPVSVNLYTDATSHSVAAIVSFMRTSVAQAFVNTEEINRVGVIAAIPGLTWACGEEFLNTHVILYVDNTADFTTLRRGTGALWRFHDLRRLYLSMLHSLRCNTWEVRQVAGLENPADRPSRAVLAALLREAKNPLPPTDRAEDRVLPVPRGWW